MTWSLSTSGMNPLDTEVPRFLLCPLLGLSWQASPASLLPLSLGLPTPYSEEFSGHQL